MACHTRGPPEANVLRHIYIHVQMQAVTLEDQLPRAKVLSNNYIIIFACTSMYTIMSISYLHVHVGPHKCCPRCNVEPVHYKEITGDHKVNSRIISFTNVILGLCICMCKFSTTSSGTGGSCMYIRTCVSTYV